MDMVEEDRTAHLAPMYIQRMAGIRMQQMGMGGYFTFSLLIVLTLIRTLPILVDPDTLIATPGLCHLNFHQHEGAF